MKTLKIWMGHIFYFYFTVCRSSLQDVFLALGKRCRCWKNHPGSSMLKWIQLGVVSFVDLLFLPSREQARWERWLSEKHLSKSPSQFYPGKAAKSRCWRKETWKLQQRRKLSCLGNCWETRWTWESTTIQSNCRWKKITYSTTMWLFTRTKRCALLRKSAVPPTGYSCRGGSTAK